MRSRVASLLAGFALALSLAGAAQAQIQLDRPISGGGAGGGGQQPAPQPTSGVITGTTPDLTLRALQAAGYQNGSMVNVNNQQTPRAEINGIPMLALHYQCEGGKCSSLTFFTSFGKQSSVDLNWINAFNRDKRFVRLYQDKEQNVIMEMDVHFFGGATQEYLKQSASLFGILLKALTEYRPS